MASSATAIAAANSSDVYDPPSKCLLINEPDPLSVSSYPTHIAYNQSLRTAKDLHFLTVFLLFILFTFAFGIFAAFHQNPNSSSLTSFSYDPTSDSCIKAHNSSFISRPGRVLYVSISDSSGIWKNLVWTLVITLILSVPFSIILLFSLKHYAKQLVFISLPFFLIVPMCIDVYWFISCTLSSTCSEKFPLVTRILILVFVLLVIGLILWMFVANWGRVELTVRIVKIASDALTMNLGLFGVLPVLNLVLIAYYVPILVFMLFARLNGEIVPEEKDGEIDCVWSQDSWVPAYYALAGLTMMWSAAAMVEAQVFVISGTIAQWYFSKDNSKAKQSIRGSLRNAFGPSSGTICLSGLLIAIVRIVRAAIDNVSEEDAGGISNLVFRCFVNGLLSAFEFLNKFTINFAAITGEAYCTSAKMAYELLRRNLLSAVVVETISTRLLSAIIFVLSAVYFIVVCGILKLVSDLGTDSYFVAAMAFMLLITILGFFVHLLEHVINTVYICYAIDKDRGEVCKPDVHEVYVHLPVHRDHNRPFLNARSPLFV